jgi:hypothetical protein
LKRARILAGTGIITIVCAIYLWNFGPQTFFAVETRYWARTVPVIKKVPVELGDLSASSAAGKKLTYFGYEFEVPWDDIDEAKSHLIGKIAIVAFRSGNVLSVMSGQPRELVKMVQSSGKVDDATFVKLYGNDALNSDYAFLRIMLETTPDQITPFVSKKQAASSAMLLMMKGFAASRRGDSSLFVVRAADMSGFQFGHPSDSSDGFDVELFSESGELDFVFGQKANGTTKIVQSDINRILRTLHKVSDTSAANADLPILKSEK